MLMPHVEAIEKIMPKSVGDHATVKVSSVAGSTSGGGASPS
jgi:hypothetical protein